MKSIPVPTATELVSVPTKLLGMVLDRGSASAYAAHLIAIKRSKGSGFVLNEHHCRKTYGISRRGFQLGMRVLTATKVLNRTQRARRYAVETLAHPGRNYILIPEMVLCQPSKLVAFVLVANMAPKPMRPADAARRIGINTRGKARGATRELTNAAIGQGLVASAVVARGAILIARRGHQFNLVENVPAEIMPTDLDPTHSSKKDCTINERLSQQTDRGYASAASPAEAPPLNGRADDANRKGALTDPRLLGQTHALEHLGELHAADGAKILAPRLFGTGKRGLTRLVNEFGIEATIATIKAVLTRAMIDGGESGSVTTWSYFRPALLEQQMAEEMAAAGLRPGDVFGAHRAFRLSRSNE